MKITFLRPNIFNARAADAMEPLAFAILAGLTPEDVEVELVDERLEEVDFDIETNLVAMSVQTYHARRSYQIAREFRKRGVPVVMGGYHPTFAAEEALKYVDAVVVGDAEEVWPRIVSDARAGKMKGIYRSDAMYPLAGMKFDRRIFRGKRYAPIPLVQYGRGCRYACEFCSIHAFYGTDLRQRPVGEVVEEIASLNRRHIFIVDDNIFVNVPKAREFFEALIPLKIRWSCQVSVDVASDPELMKLLEKSGCTTAVIGFESLDHENLKQMRKQWNVKRADYATSVQVFQDHGVMIYGTFVFGYDYDTVDSFDRCLEFALESKFYLANFNPLTPMPGAALYDRLKKEGRLIRDPWWLSPEFRYGDATFHPRGMTAEQLAEGCYRARCEFNKYGSILSRAADRRVNARDLYRLGVFAASNLVSRKEIHRKQGQRLGDDSPLEEFATEAGVGI